MRPLTPPGIPTGWFSLLPAAELRPGAVVPLRRFGQELVLFRTRSGAAALAEAACPHLGAHLGQGGRVDGETLVCPFHGHRFLADGACSATGSGLHGPAGSRLGTLPVAERAGVLFGWYAPDGRAPDWELPEVDDSGWPRHRLRRVAVDAHPQDTTENSVDLAHFTWVHGYEEPRILTPLKRDGHKLTIAYAATRRTGPFGARVSFTWHVEVFGLGFSRVRVSVDGLATSELLVMASPVDARRSEVLLGARVRVGDGALARLAGELASPVMAGILQRDVLQDASVWSHKLWVARPRLAADDGPIGVYRAWAARFDEGEGRVCAAPRRDAAVA